MSYSKQITWHVTPTNMPVVRKNCPKCGNNATYINSGKFRVNANKRNVDIWLIYHCEKCKSTWNMTIYERINPQEIDNTLFERFMNNDLELAKEYGFNIAVHNSNKARLDFSCIEYDILGDEVDMKPSSVKEPIIITIQSAYALDLRMDKVLSKKMNLSRSQIKKLYKEERIWVIGDKNLLNQRLQDEIEIIVC